MVIYFKLRPKRDGAFVFKCFAETYRSPFKYHFTGPRPTNQIQKPEFYITYILKLIKLHQSFFESAIQQLVLVDESNIDVNALVICFSLSLNLLTQY